MIKDCLVDLNKEMHIDYKLYKKGKYDMKLNINDIKSIIDFGHGNKVYEKQYHNDGELVLVRLNYSNYKLDNTIYVDKKETTVDSYKKNDTVNEEEKQESITEEDNNSENDKVNEEEKQENINEESDTVDEEDNVNEETNYNQYRRNNKYNRKK